MKMILLTACVAVALLQSTAQAEEVAQPFLEEAVIPLPIELSWAGPHPTTAFVFCKGVDGVTDDAELMIRAFQLAGTGGSVNVQGNGVCLVRSTIDIPPKGTLEGGFWEPDQYLSGPMFYLGSRTTLIAANGGAGPQPPHLRRSIADEACPVFFGDLQHDESGALKCLDEGQVVNLAGGGWCREEPWGERLVHCIGEREISIYRSDLTSMRFPYDILWKPWPPHSIVEGER